MGDMSPIIQPKSDQLNGDSLIAGPITIKVREVKLTPGQEQPCSVFYEGDDGKPYKPCKSMAKLMVKVWGEESKGYVGKSMTLFRDPEVKWAGMKVGGIRISHMSHMERDFVTTLTASKGNFKPYVVKPLKADVAPLKVVTPEPDAPNQPDAFDVLTFVKEVTLYISTACDADELSAWWAEKMPLRKQAAGVDAQAARQIAASVTAKINELKGEI